MSLFRKILIGYDQSEQAEDALALGRLLGDATGAKLVVAGVFRFDPLFAQAPWFEEAETDCARSVAQAAESLGAEPETIPSTSPARGLHDLAEDIDAGLIVVGSSHRGRFGRALAGSVGLSLLNGAPCAVAIAPRGYATQPVRSVSTVVVGFDGSAESGLALLEAEQPRPGGRLDRQARVGDRGARESTSREVAQASLHEACRSVPAGIPVERRPGDGRRGRGAAPSVGEEGRHRGRRLSRLRAAAQSHARIGVGRSSSTRHRRR